MTRRRIKEGCKIRTCSGAFYGAITPWPSYLNSCNFYELCVRAMLKTCRKIVHVSKHATWANINKRIVIFGVFFVFVPIDLGRMHYSILDKFFHFIICIDLHANIIADDEKKEKSRCIFNGSISFTRLSVISLSQNSYFLSSESLVLPLPH